MDFFMFPEEGSLKKVEMLQVGMANTIKRHQTPGRRQRTTMSVIPPIEKRKIILYRRITEYKRTFKEENRLMG
ncbi:hypothetical protein [[Clostridium] symbiosum]|uniref:hypothetical protein n=1 Tax=Clostridium symbiosum TaxID=1512 RepID=UPI001FB7EB70|nr:hypothetical protein [[Clostridium] symbiosum]